MHGHNINLPVCVCLSVCLYVPHNDQLGRTHFPHNVSLARIGVCVCVSIALSVNSPTGQTPQQIFTVDSLKDADLRKDVPFVGLDDE